MNKKIALFFLFSALIFIKVSSFHVYSHQNDNENKIENCSICDIASLNQQNQFVVSQEINIPDANFIFVPYQSNFKASSSRHDSGTVFSLYSRPPPAQI